MMSRTLRRFVASGLRILTLLAIILGGLWLALAQPVFSRADPSANQVEPEKLEAHVVMLSQTLYPRNWLNTSNLAACADYIAEQFKQAGAETRFQEFTAGGNSYRNVIGRFSKSGRSTLVIGAHYDAHQDTPGADDNASGVAALIGLAHLLGENPPDRDIELVAFCLEEPPFFRTPKMGSAVHANALVHDNRKVAGMIALEMVGFFSDKPGSQKHPSRLLRLFYPGRGNFIGVIGRSDQGRWIKQVKRGMKGATDLPVYSIRAPASLPGVDFSDHLNYWAADIPAVMVTDTAFYRNTAYHSREDTADRLDYRRMSMVVIALRRMIDTL